MDYIFFAGLVLYFISLVCQFFGSVFHKDGVQKISWLVFIVGACVSTVYLVVRGVTAGRLPMSNQFEFAATFSWGIALILIFIVTKFNLKWLITPGIFATWLIALYAAMLPKEITDLMPALRSVWFGVHIGSAAFSYAAFMLAGACGIRYLLLANKQEEEKKLTQIDYFSYRLIAIGFLLLTVTIIIGAIWAEEAWSSFWTWDPKEVWALITWIVYAVYLHLRLSQKKRGTFMAWYAIISVPVVLFTFVGVNTLMPGLHSYGMLEIFQIL